MIKKKVFAKLHGKIIPYKVKKIDLGFLKECSICAKNDLENGMKFRRRLLPLKDLVTLDNGKHVCQECLVT